MKVAAAAYPLDWFDDWSAYVAKITRWVQEAAGEGADLLVFPEYGAMELSTLDGAAAAGDLERSLHAVSRRMPDVDTLHLRLAAEFGVHILGASAPVFDGGARPVNRATLYTPNGQKGVQDKQIMTMFERDPWNVTNGEALTVFDTTLGKIGVLICYDSEFPLLGRALADVDVLLVPSCTEALAGYWRVRIGAMARALENQCVSVMSSIVGPAEWSEAVDQNTGMGGIFGPPDTGFPATGVLAEGVLNKPGWTYADVDLEAIAHVRRDGVVRNRTHWDERAEPGKTVTICPLR
ncbi:carbon-nitrogen hydrolase family protein [Phaeobacter inhibens]|uniref:carbon-nitrogen hydrolase family protein n=1 Tax=Phaeobacter inhibens TaxID=221822 RepID=UPI00076BB975|nr:carbon-nitrogen hydrolase family protein [Phaeobacter inhibens]KXF91422.1 amidohydrolase [Phaeobacter inhibens]WHP68739.1 carbon-nitrogen hydrolase family protein [Phaeobacter inhibens]